MQETAGDTGLIMGLRRSLEEEMAAHSSILTWEIPWTEEPGGLQSLGSQRVRHDRVTNTFTFKGDTDLESRLMGTVGADEGGVI